MKTNLGFWKGTWFSYWSLHVHKSQMEGITGLWKKWCHSCAWQKGISISKVKNVHLRKTNLKSKIALHTYENGQYLEYWWQQMLTRMWKTGTFIHRWWECDMAYLHWKSVWYFPMKLNIFLLCNPAIQQTASQYFNKDIG
jgi:hypothetical protein